MGPGMTSPLMRHARHQPCSPARQPRTPHDTQRRPTLRHETYPRHHPCRQPRTRGPVSAATLTRWQTVVDELSRRAGHAAPPPVQWCIRPGTRYTPSTDTIGVNRAFARRWTPTSPKAQWLLVHELGHRSHPYTAAQAERAALHSTPAIAVGVAGMLIGTALFLVQFPPPVPVSCTTR